MRVLMCWCVFAVLAACGEVRTTPSDASTQDRDASIDATGSGDANTSDASTARCDPTKPFGAPTLVANVNTSNDDVSFTLTRDERTAFVGRVVQPPTPSATILVAERQSTDADFGGPASTYTASINNASGDEYAPSPVADGLILYFHRQTASSGIGIVAATRADATSTFSAGAAVTVDGSALLNALAPAISADGQTLYWIDFNDFKMHAATRGSTPTAFVNARDASTITLAGQPVLSSDELTLYYSQGNGVDVLESKRTDTSSMFGTGVPVANVNSAMDDSPVAVTGDGCILYISSTRSGGLGGHDIWQARRPM